MLEVLSSMKKKVLFVATEFASGMIPYASTIINAPAGDPRFDVSCLCVNSGNKSYRRHISSNVNATFVEYPTFKALKLLYKFYPVRIYSKMMNLIETESPDVIHFLTGDFSLALSLMLGGKNKNKMFYTVHDLTPHETVKQSVVKSCFRNYYLWGNKQMRVMINNITTSSKRQVDMLKEMYPQKSIYFAPFPTLITKDIENGQLQAPELKECGPYLLYFGNINKYKGVDLLVKAYEESKLSDKVKLVIAGKGGMYDHIMGPNIIRLNRFIDDAEVGSLFKNARFVIYPYRSATMSGVLSLAFYFKKQVLLSDISFFKQYDNALCTYFKAKDVNDLAAKMLVAYDKTYNKDNSSNNSYYSFYSLDSLRNSYYNIYNSKEL